MIILDGKGLAERKHLFLKEQIDIYTKQGFRKPCLAIIQVGDDPASNSYIKGKRNACEQVGIDFIHINFSYEIIEQEISDTIQKLNQDDKVDGILVQLPIPKHLNEKKLTNEIDYLKDVDGFHLVNRGLLFEGQPGIRPATPQGIMDLLDEYKIDVKGMNAVVVGRSVIVGLPVAKMLIDRHATVTTCHSKTIDIGSITKNADILVVAIGKPKFITKDMVKENAIIIDVGINRVDGKLCGDVDFENVKEKTSHITPVPKGVGPMTISALLHNTFNNYLKKIL